MKIYTGIEMGKRCWRCGKPIVQYYNILCMDCADELGISELFLRNKSEEEIIKIVKEKIKKDIEKAVRWVDGKLVVLWYPMLSRFPNITLKGLLTLMFGKEVKR